MPGEITVRKRDTCIIETCHDTTTQGLWCERHWQEHWERDVDITAHSFQNEKAMAERIVEQSRCREFVNDVIGMLMCDPSSGCGHLLVVHSYGGCHGLTGNDSIGWGPCACQEYVPMESSDDEEGDLTP